MKDLYAALGVPRTASKSEIKKAYRELTQKFHPDKNPGDAAAEERFKEANTAYDVLGDEDKRQLYDEFGEMSLTQGFDAERARAYKAQQQAYAGGFPGGSYGGFPGGGAPGGFHFESYGDAQNTSFDELLSRLFGGGRVTSADDLFGGGGGVRTRRGQDIEGDISISFIDALVGLTVPLRVEGRDGQARTLDVKVPRGMHDGGKLRLRGQGGQGQPSGDIILTVHVKPHRALRREGQNLRMTVPISAYEAYRGGPVDIPTPWGEVTLKIPAGAQNGATLRLRGKGVQQANKQPGDLYVVLDVKLPEPGDPELMAALERLQAQTNVREEFGL